MTRGSVPRQVRRCACGCGMKFEARAKEQRRYYDREHADRRRGEVGRRMRDQRRLGRFQRQIAELLGEDRRITQAQLLALVQSSFRLGYQAGYKRIEMRVRRNPELAMTIGEGPCG